MTAPIITYADHHPARGPAWGQENVHEIGHGFKAVTEIVIRTPAMRAIRGVIGCRQCRAGLTNVRSIAAYLR